MDNPIRVLQMIGSLNIGGSQTVVLNLYKAIDRDKIQFDFIIDKPNEKVLAPLVESLGGRIFVLPGFHGNNLLEIRRSWDLFFKQHPEYKVLHSHKRSYASLYLPIARKNGVKTIIHSHSTSNGQGFASLVKKLLQYPLRYQADYFISCSKESGNWLFGKKITASPKYHLLQNAIDLSLYAPNNEIRKKIRRELGVREDQFVYIHVGRFHPSKNHTFLLQLFSAIEKRNEDSILLLVGDGELRDEIIETIKRYKVNNKVLMLGMRNDIPDLLCAADCFLFPSRWEGLPITVIEAQAAGLPCLVSANVTNDVFVSPLAKKVSIGNGIEEWLNTIDTIDKHRQDVRNYIRQAGFDIRDTAEWISNLYCLMHKGDSHFPKKRDELNINMQMIKRKN